MTLNRLLEEVGRKDERIYLENEAKTTEVSYVTYKF